MYKLVDAVDGTSHEMNESQIKNYLKNELDIAEADNLEIEEIENILHFQGFTLERLDN